LIMGTFRRKTEKADPNFPKTFSFKGGLKALIDALMAEIGDGIKLSTPVIEIEETDDGKFRVNGQEFDTVVVSTRQRSGIRCGCCFHARVCRG
jgi:predicted NAD/FAD-binding protein